MIEIQLLNYILSKKDESFITIKGITSEYFQSYKNEFNFIRDHYLKYNTIPDITTFLNTFPDFDVINVDESPDYLLSELYRSRSENYLVYNFNKMKDLLQKGKTEEAESLFTRAAQNMSSIKTLEAVDILSDISRYNEYLDKCDNYSKYYIPTGFKELDDSLGGGIDRKNAYFVISARAGIGKTLVMIEFAKASVERGLNVGLFEGEMTVEKIAGRYDTLVSHISNSAITHGRIDVSLNYKKYLDGLKENHKGSLYVLTKDMAPDGKVTVDTLRGFVDKYNLDVLFIDQLSLLDDSTSGKKFYEQASELSKAIKNLQVTKHIPIILASQQNRSSIEDGKVAGTENLSLSDRIGQDATEVLFLTKKDDGIMQFNIAKARDGCKKNILNYSVDFDKGKFMYIPESEDDNTESGEDILNRYSPSYEEANEEEPF